MKLQSIVTVISSLAFSSLLSLGCTANLSNSAKIKLKKSTLSETIPSDNNRTPDNAKGSCALLDPSNPERTTCTNCYEVILKSNCDDAQDPAQCLNPLIAYQFSTLLQQCVVQTMDASLKCSNTCAPGQILEPGNCHCSNQFPKTQLNHYTEGGTGDRGNNDSGNTINTEDSGSHNVGPPLVWSTAPFENVQNLQKTQDQCRARIGPITFNLQNRGTTVVYNNTYEARATTCDGSLTKTDTPVLTSSHETQTGFEILTAGEKEYSETIYNWPGTQEQIWSTALTKTLGTLLPSKTQNNTVSTNHFAGPFSNFTSDNSPLLLDLGPLPTGQYKISFDLYFFYPFFPVGQPPPDQLPELIDIEANDKNIFHFFFSIDPSRNHPFTPKYPKKPTVLLETYYPNFQLHTSVLEDKKQRTRTRANPAGRFTTYLITFTFQHQEGPLKLRLKRFLQGPIQSKWGFNYLKIQKAPIKKCAIKYTFTDSFKAKSQYCLRFTVRTDCSPLNADGTLNFQHPPVECTCSVGTDPTDLVPYWQLDTSNSLYCN